MLEFGALQCAGSISFARRNDTNECVGEGSIICWSILPALAGKGCLVNRAQICNVLTADEFFSGKLDCNLLFSNETVCRYSKRNDEKATQHKKFCARAKIAKHSSLNIHCDGLIAVPARRALQHPKWFAKRTPAPRPA
jgi:hypothetical protein